MRTYVAPCDAAHDAASTYVAYLHRSPRRWVTYVLFIPIYVMLFTGAADILGYHQTTASAVGIAIVATCAAVLGMNLWPYAVMRRSAKLAFAAGATYESAWDETRFWVRGPSGAEGLLPYALVKSTVRRGNWVFLRTTNSRMVYLYPSALLCEAAMQGGAAVSAG